MADGFIKLYSKMLKWEWYDDINTKVVFIHCLLKANWKSGSWHGIKYDAGQFITSLPTLAKETKLSVRQVRVALDHLKLTGEVTDKRQANCRIITVVKWNEYQCYDRPIDRPMTDQRQTCDRPVTADKEYKEYKDIKDNKDINTIKHKHGEYQHVLLTDKEMGKLIETYGKDIAERAVEFLDAYIEEKGYKAKSHYLTIRRWVIDAVKEKKNNGRPGHDVRRNEEDDKELDEAVERFLAGDYDDEPLF